MRKNKVADLPMPIGVLDGIRNISNNIEESPFPESGGMLVLNPYIQYIQTPDQENELIAEKSTVLTSVQPIQPFITE